MFGSQAQEPLYELKIKGSTTNYATQTVTNASNTEKDTARIFLSGTIFEGSEKEPVGVATYAIYLNTSTKMSEGIKRTGVSDKGGRYKVDVTSIADSTETLVIRSFYIQHQVTEVVVKGKIKKSINLDIELFMGSGTANIVYKLNSKNSKLKLISKKVQPYSGPGY